jgi:hypothetical protein
MSDKKKRDTSDILKNSCNNDSNINKNANINDIFSNVRADHSTYDPSPTDNTHDSHIGDNKITKSNNNDISMNFSDINNSIKMSSWLLNFRNDVRTYLDKIKEHEKINGKRNNQNDTTSVFNEHNDNFSYKKDKEGYDNIRKERMTITDCVHLIGVLYDDLMIDEKKLKKSDENGHFKLTKRINNVRPNRSTYDNLTTNNTYYSNSSDNDTWKSNNDKDINSKIYPSWEKYTMEERTYITVKRKYGLRKIAVEKVAEFLWCLEFYEVCCIFPDLLSSLVMPFWLLSCVHVCI